MDGNPVVLDISSDEDVGFNWPATAGCDNDFDWTELFVNMESDPVDSQNREEGYDSDDVVVVKEVFAKPKRTKKSSGVANLAAQHWEEDDDCVILDGDPDKPAAEDKNSGYESDDLVIVAEKGQVACRDYPHSRHLCVKFPFGSTLHSEHCNLCHCYVCDSPAPCGNWGNGNSVTDHCHATEKEELWKAERKRNRQGGIAPVRKIRLNPTPSTVLKDLLNHAMPLTQNNYFPGETQSYDRPNIIRSQRNSGLSERSRYCPNQSSQWLSPCVNNLHSVTSSEMFKRPRPIKRRGTSVAAIHLASEQPKSNSYTNHLVGHGDGVLNVDLHQNSSAVNTSTISAGPTPSQGQATQSQLYGQSTARANGSLDENVSSPVSSNTSYQQIECQLPLTEDQSWNSVNPDVCNWEGLDDNDAKVLHELSVMAAENGFHTESLWTHF